MDNCLLFVTQGEYITILFAISVYTLFCADCEEGELSCPNFEFECKSMEQWTRCYRGQRAGQCVAKRLECDAYDQCMNNYTSAGCRELLIRVIVLTDGVKNDHFGVNLPSLI